MPRCLIALGGNLGVSESVFKRAMNRLQRPEIRVNRLSSMVRTKAVGENAGEEYLNAAVTLDCNLSARSLLTVLHEVEAEFGRTRTIHWGPRSLDLDLCLWGDASTDQPDLVVPHPAMWYRRFVLDPAAEIASEMLHPLLGQSVGELHQRLHRRPLQILVRSNFADGGRDACQVSALVETLTRLNDKVEWIAESESSDQHKSDCFAVLSIERLLSLAATQSSPVEKPPAAVRTQPYSETTRTLRVFAADETQLRQEVHLLLAAILG